MAAQGVQSVRNGVQVVVEQIRVAVEGWKSPIAHREGEDAREHAVHFADVAGGHTGLDELGDPCLHLAVLDTRQRHIAPTREDVGGKDRVVQSGTTVQLGKADDAPPLMTGT